MGLCVPPAGPINSWSGVGAARERPVSPVAINLAAGDRSLLGETVGRVHLGNLGGGILRSIVVALKRRCVWWGRRWGTDKELRLTGRGGVRDWLAKPESKSTGELSRGREC